jgi:hypothetical protein
MPKEILDALTLGVTDWKTYVIAGMVLAIPAGLSVWGIKAGVKAVPGMIRGFLKG